MNIQDYIQRVFSLEKKEEFSALALEAFEFQRLHCKVYKEYLDLIGKGDFHPASIEEIPFLPIRLFKSTNIYSDPGIIYDEDYERKLKELLKRVDEGEWVEELGCIQECSIYFESSATTGMTPSRHMIVDPTVYEQSFKEGFRRVYGESGTYNLMALLPSYLERKHSSLVYMAEGLMQDAKQNGATGDFFLYDHDRLLENLKRFSSNKETEEGKQPVLHTSQDRTPENQQSGELNKKERRKTILLGVSFALLDFAEYVKLQVPDPDERAALFSDVIVIETGGMKGRGEELSREELHGRLRDGFVSARIDSEYGMCELLSQAYSIGNLSGNILEDSAQKASGTNQKELRDLNSLQRTSGDSGKKVPEIYALQDVKKEEGVFFTPPWMRVLARDLMDPFKVKGVVEGGLNIIDLANIWSCCFIETEDRGRIFSIAEEKKSVHPVFTVDGRIQNSELRGCNMLLG